MSNLRADVISLALTVNRSARRPATFVDERQDSAGFEDSPGSRSRRPGYGVVPYFPPSSTLKRYPIYAAK